MPRPLPRIPAALAAALLTALAACSESPPPAPAVPAGPPPAPTLEQLLSATVSGVLDAPVTLNQGVYEGPAAEGGASHPSVTLQVPSVLFGDVDGKPGNEAIASLVAETGGSGSFLHVGVFGLQDGKAVSLATTLIGDRLQLNRLWVEHGQVHMDVVEPGPKDPACCPSQLSRKVFVLEGGALKPVSSDVVGALSINLLAATDWILAEMDGRKVATDKPPTLLVQYGKVMGFAGCNRYTGALKEAAPGSITVGPLAVTKMACPAPASELEAAFVTRMNQVKGYSFVAGQLALHWADKDQQGTLVFGK